MAFTFDMEQTLDAMAYAGSVDLQHGQVTLFAVVCVGSGEEPHFSHGGSICVDPEEAIDAALQANELTPGDCRYLPMALGMRMEDLVFMAQALVRGMPDPEEG